MPLLAVSKDRQARRVSVPGFSTWRLLCSCFWAMTCYLITGYNQLPSPGKPKGELSTFLGVLPNPHLREVAALFKSIFDRLQKQSLSIRPSLLNPDTVPAALRTHIQPQSCSLNCFATLPPPAKSFQFPEDVPPVAPLRGSYIASM